MPKNPTTAISILGSVLDSAREDDRWHSWRPTVGQCCQEDFLVDKLVLIHQRNEKKLLNVVMSDIQSVSPETTIVPVELSWKDPWDFEEVYASLHQFARDQAFNDDKTDLLVGITTGTHVAQICLYLLTESRHLPGQLLQLSPPKRNKRGGHTNHIGTYRIIDLDLSQYDAIASRFDLEKKESLSFLKSGITTKNAAFNQLIERIEKVSIASEHPILLTGPTGAGKSQLARRIYELKKMRNQIEGQLVSVNCATLVGDHAMSSLFGHAKGAFTGAATARSGLLKAADQGMLFLDEIGELGIDEQAMLLKAIEEKRFLPLGSDKELESDFQLIAGTNRDLKKAAAEGRFREDLLARINLWTFDLPGLADRREDIEANLEYELAKYTETTGNTVRFASRARKKFLEFADSPEATWNANFRDLNAAITRMATLGSAGKIAESTVAEECGRLLDSWSADESSLIDHQTEVSMQQLLGANWRAKHDLFDQQQIVEVVRVCRESKTLADAGRKLFAVSRASKKRPNDSDRLRKYLAKNGLSWQMIVDGIRS